MATEAKPKLQSLFPDKKLYTPVEAMKANGWKVEEHEDGSIHGFCCGKEVKYAGWIGVEHAYCPKCGKGIQDVLGILPSGNSTAGLIDCEKVDFSDGRHWVAENVWGLRSED